MTSDWKQGSDIQHSPPLYMQAAPPNLEAVAIRKQIFTWCQAIEVGLDRSVINTETAMEIASWWAENDNAFEKFANTGEIVPEFAEEIAYKREHIEFESNRQSLDALAAYINHSITKGE